MSEITDIGAPDLTDDDARDRWRIDCDDLANWALRKLADAQAEQARLRVTASAERTRIDEWFDTAAATVQRDADFFTARLVEYRRDLEAVNPKLPKTYRLPCGTLTRRARPAKVEVADTDAFAAWAREHHPEALATRPLTSQLRGDRWVQSVEAGADGVLIDATTGEIVPGVVVTDQDDNLSATPADMSGEPWS